MSKHFVFVTTLACLVLAGLAYAASPQQQIQAAYDKANQAMKLKYIDGVMSIRSGRYRAYDAAGRVINPRREIQQLQQALAASTSVSETTEIVQFAQMSDHEAKARIKDSILLNLSAAGAKARPPVLIKTIADDTWVFTHHEWKLASTRILQQVAAPQSPAK